MLHRVFFVKMLTIKSRQLFSQKSPIKDIWQGPEYASADSKI